MTNVAFIGIGAMGEPMAGNLLKKGLGVTIVKNRRPEPVDRLKELGAKVATTPAEAAAGADIVLSGLLGADFEPFTNPCQGGWVGLLYGQVIEHRDRLSADADDVVDVHRDAVDTDRFEPVGLLGKDELRTDAVC